MRSVSAVDLARGVHVRTVVGESGSFSLGDFESASAAPFHHHTREQADVALDGVFDMTIASHVEPLSPGAGVIIPPDVAHSLKNNTGRLISVIEFHTVRRPDLVPPRPAITFPASPEPVDTPGGRSIVVPLKALSDTRDDRRAEISGETCILAWRRIPKGATSDLNSTAVHPESFFYVLAGEAALLTGRRREPAPAGTLIVIPAGFTGPVEIQVAGAADAALAEFSLRTQRQ